MKLYRCIVKMGHAGSGKYLERAIFVWARNAGDAMNKAKHYRGVKKGAMMRSGGSVIAVEEAGDVDKE